MNQFAWPGSARNSDMTSRQGSEKPEIRVLVYENDVRFRKLLDLYLKVDGFTSILAASTDEVLQTIREQPHHVDVLITNVLMQSGDGVRFAEQCREIKPDLNVLFVSSESREELVSCHDLEIPANQFLHKPFNVRTLTRKIAELVAS